MDFAVPYFFQMELMLSCQGQLLCVNVVGRGVLAPVELSENSTFLRELQPVQPCVDVVSKNRFKFQASSLFLVV